MMDSRPAPASIPTGAPVNGSGPCCGGLVMVIPNTLGLGLGITLASGDAVSVEVGSTLSDGETDGVGVIEDVSVDVGETDGDGDPLPHGFVTC